MTSLLLQSRHFWYIKFSLRYNMLCKWFAITTLSRTSKENWKTYIVKWTYQNVIPYHVLWRFWYCFPTVVDNRNLFSSYHSQISMKLLFVWARSSPSGRIDVNHWSGLIQVSYSQASQPCQLSTPSRRRFWRSIWLQMGP